MAKKPVPFGKRLKQLRKERGLSKYALGKLAGVTGQTLYKIESGKTLTWETACKIADALGVDLETFRA